MGRTLTARLRSLLAAMLMVAGGLPAALELTGHAPEAEGSLHHVEAASVRHHGDHCLATAWVASEKVAPMAAPPVLAMLVDPAAITGHMPVGRPTLPEFRRPTSRGPPETA